MPARSYPTILLDWINLGYFKTVDQVQLSIKRFRDNSINPFGEENK